MIGLKKFSVILGVSIAVIQFSGCGSILYGDSIERADRNAQELAPRSIPVAFDEVEAKRAMGQGQVEIKSVLVSCYGRGMLCMIARPPPPLRQVRHKR